MALPWYPQAQILLKMISSSWRSNRHRAFPVFWDWAGLQLEIIAFSRLKIRQTGPADAAPSIRPGEIVGNLILVKNSLELKLVGFPHLPKAGITRPIMNPLSDGLSHTQLFFQFIVAQGRSWEAVYHRWFWKSLWLSRCGNPSKASSAPAWGIVRLDYSPRPAFSENPRWPDKLPSQALAFGL